MESLSPRRPTFLAAIFAVSAALGFAQSSPRALTSDNGVEDYPSFSPDGRVLAYAASPVGDVFGGNWDVWLMEIESGARRNLTASHDGDDRFPSFAPSGDAIAFWSDRRGGAYYVVDVDGGRPRRVESSRTFAPVPLGGPPTVPSSR